MKKLFVGNLPYDAAAHQLQEWFLQSGFPTHSISIATDILSGQPRGFGSVELDEQLADGCIAACNGGEFHGRTLVVNHLKNGNGPASAGVRRRSATGS